MSDRATLSRIRAFLDTANPPTPCLVVDIDAVSDRAALLQATFPGARVLYAVKANPAPAVVHALAEAGLGFDVASVGEIDLCLANGADPAAISFGNPIKKAADVARAYALGVREFVTDASADLANIAMHAPGSRVTARIAIDAPDSVTPFGRKFGCAPEMAVELLIDAAAAGLRPAGVAFHVGSQQLDLAAWDIAMAAVAKVFAAVADHGVTLDTVNIGGGMGVAYTGPAPRLDDYADAVRGALRRHFPRAGPRLALEPGRIMVAEAGLLRTEVILVSKKSSADDHRWVYLDIGRYNGLAETENEAITYQLALVREHADAVGPVIVAGPTCDGDDVLYQRTSYRLPLDLSSGDRLDVLDAGAYTASYSSVAFNGIDPLRTYCLSGGRLIDEC
ncbi:type III PLP-dependent enzyme [Skermania sp. ID1734]|uniref:type III PLP-dependent enzyme n=1 Tax=Skermania sp. ID1734 TaxID=2597516 RepID=UPI0011801143|nr:type III PLP-dependent enzyme [Skermania sp. ID1734]TSE01655.1 type III PLP-dependent enzyme [Skermania sp. ID1734]